MKRQKRIFKNYAVINCADFSDWRLPTLAEAMTLMEPVKKNEGLFIDSIFDPQQRWIWTSDKQSASGAWVVDFNFGGCTNYPLDDGNDVRAVR
ncbi:DUF1566 domain-containing protein [candidate division KSB1 bacterium]|nr:DUF1566 domain-containing protein [candidate division KSB1 bacterium]